MNPKTALMQQYIPYRSLSVRLPVQTMPPAHLSDDTSVAIRPGRPADAPILARLGAAAFADTHRMAFKTEDLANYLDQSLGVQRITADLADPHVTFLLAEIASAVGGFVKLSATPAPASVQTPLPVELSRLYLEPRFIGRGVGSRLMKSALAQAAYNHYATVWLYVWQGNTRAIEFYRNWGFRLVGLEKIRVGQSGPMALVMTRPVAQTVNSF